MKRILMASCVAAACSVGVAAQTTTGSKPQSPTTTKEQPAQKSGAADDKSAVVRGCLRAGDQSGTFVLSNASATSGGTLKNATVQLTGSPSGANLKDHVGHTVEVTGMLTTADAKSSGSSTGTGTGTGKTGAGTGAGAAGTGAGSTSKSATGSTAASATAKLAVKALKHVKADC